MKLNNNCLSSSLSFGLDLITQDLKAHISMPCQNKNVVKPHEILHSGEVAKMMHNGLVYNRKSLFPNLAQPWTQKK